MHWIPLRPELEGLVVPTTGIAATGRPMIAITATDVEITDCPPACRRGARGTVRFGCFRVSICRTLSARTMPLTDALALASMNAISAEISAVKQAVELLRKGKWKEATDVKKTLRDPV